MTTNINDWMNENVVMIPEDVFSEDASDRDIKLLESIDEASYAVQMREFEEELIENDEVKQLYQEEIDDMSDDEELDKKYKEFSKNSLNNPLSFKDWLICVDRISSYGGWASSYIENQREQGESWYEDRWDEYLDNNREVYYPMLYANYIFPTMLTAEELNLKGIPNLTFFKIEYKHSYHVNECVLEEELDRKYEDYKDFDAQDSDEVILSKDEWIEERKDLIIKEMEEEKETLDYEVSTGVLMGSTCYGMDITPAYYYAYMMYSTLYLDNKPILNNLMRNSKSFYEYIIGKERFKRFEKKLGIEDVEKYVAESERRTKQFDEDIDKIQKFQKSESEPKILSKIGAVSAFLKTTKDFNPEKEE